MSKTKRHKFREDFPRIRTRPKFRPFQHDDEPIYTIGKSANIERANNGSEEERNLADNY